MKNKIIFALFAFLMPILLWAIPGNPVPANYSSVDILDSALRGFNALSPEEQSDIAYYKDKNQSLRGKLANSYATNCVPVRLSWSGTIGKCRVVVTRFEDGKVVFSDETSSGYVRVKGLEVGKNYQWTVTEGDTTCAWYFYTKSDVPRILPKSFCGIENCRDMGGYETSFGKVVKQGMIYRSAKFDGASEETQEFWRKQGLKLDIDLRHDTEVTGRSSSDLGVDVRWYCPRIECGEKFGSYGRIFTNDEQKVSFRATFTNLLSTANYPAIFHCTYGRDRTGMLAYFIGGILGVSMDDLWQDYLYTMVYNKDDLCTDDFYWVTTMSEMFEEYYPSQNYGSLVERFEAFFHDCGITDAEIARFREIMLVESESLLGESVPGAVRIPNVAARAYTGEHEVAEIAGNDFYYASVNKGGTAVGKYGVTLKLRDSSYTWEDGTRGDKQCYFVIEKAQNNWMEEPSVSSWKLEEEQGKITKGRAKFGSVVCSLTEADLANFVRGTYEATFSVAGTENYSGLTKTVKFRVTDSTDGTLYSWKGGEGLWANEGSWKVSGYPSMSNDCVYFSSSLTSPSIVDLGGESFEFLVLTNKSKIGVTIKNGSLLSAPGKSWLLYGNTTFDGVNISGYRMYLGDDADGKTVTFRGNCNLNGFVYRTSANGTTLRICDGIFSATSDFEFYKLAKSDLLNLAVERAQVSCSGSFAAPNTIALSVVYPKNFDEVQAAPITFAGTFSGANSSTLHVDASALEPGLYRLLSAGTLDIDFATVSATVKEGYLYEVVRDGNMLWFRVVPSGVHIHSWGEWQVVTEPTADVAGEKRRYCTGCEEFETEVIPPVTAVSGLYKWQGGASGVWANSASWSGVEGGTYPHLDGDGARITSAAEIDLGGKSFSILTVTNSANGTVVKNGALNLTGKGFLAQANTTFYGVTLKGNRIYAMNTGLTITFAGDCALTDGFYYHSLYDNTLVVTDGVTRMESDFSWASSSSLTLNLKAQNGRLVAKSLTNKNVNVEIKLGVKNSSSTAAVLSFTEDFAPANAGSLIVDASAVSEGEYLLVSGASIVTFGSKNATCRDGLKAEYVESAGSLLLRITKEGGEEEPDEPIVGDVSGLYKWQGGASGMWANSASWSGVLGGTYPHLDGDGARITSAAEIDLGGKSFSILTVTNSANGTVVKNGALNLTGKGIIAEDNLTLRDVVLTGSRMYAGKSGKTITFAGDCALRDSFYFHTCNSSYLALQDGVTQMESDFSWANSCSLSLKVRNAFLRAKSLVGGTTVKVTISLGERNTTTSDAVLTFSGRFGEASYTNLVVDASGKSAGRYMLITASELNVPDSFANNAMITSDLSARCIREGNSVVLILEQPGDDEETKIKPSDGKMVCDVVATTADVAKAMVVIEAPDGIDRALYQGYFTKNAVEVQEGKYRVSVALNRDAVGVEASLASFAVALGGVAEGDTSVTLSAKPGLYYSVKEGRSVEALKEGQRVFATGSSVTLPLTIVGGEKGFYAVSVSASK